MLPMFFVNAQRIKRLFESKFPPVGEKGLEGIHSLAIP